ncbi:type III glutamate--ammonia ligase [Streptacidiphilus sp. PB12-B1b]|uniref:type III glutamate--ammonia ligase n=1 Tax=Streptacidiphilus sp. PB12-B1b TaxID=2705012 RepID=UPI0015FBA9D8|nr:type III glutamate--ammonia ligase [Streptacidiphilus sp. PB12-B1b]QMU78166.1 type III glutamate--ammonia ligase [Streptacidiphilus sp. PB12-B1b]
MTVLPTAPPKNAEELARAVARDGIEFLLVMFVNLQGKPCAKLAPVRTLDRLLAEGLGFAGNAADGLGQSSADPDVVAIPDVTSYVKAPLQEGLGIVQCDLYVQGEPWPYAPRWILRRQLELLAEQGRQLKVGAEPEYFLVRRAEDGSIAVADELDTADSPCYDANAATRAFDHLATVSRAVDALGWENYSNDHEDANGQFEHNFGYADALRTADRVVVFRHLAKMAAHRAGLVATFMPKPFTHLTGSGLHLHVSLWDRDTDTSLFADPVDPRGMGLSQLGYSFISGLLEHAPGLMALTCPTVNSYKRLGAGADTQSHSSWAPGYASYGGNNRTHLVRIPDGGRIEIRCVDGAANPYLAIAGIAAAGADGMARGADPGDPVTGDLEAAGLRAGLRPLPPTLLHAVDELVRDGVLREGLGKVPGGLYADYFASVKRAEFNAFHRQVTGWELDRYLMF